MGVNKKQKQQINEHKGPYKIEKIWKLEIILRQLKTNHSILTNKYIFTKCLHKICEYFSTTLIVKYLITECECIRMKKRVQILHNL